MPIRASGNSLTPRQSGVCAGIRLALVRKERTEFGDSVVIRGCPACATVTIPPRCAIPVRPISRTRLPGLLACRPAPIVGAREFGFLRLTVLPCCSPVTGTTRYSANKLRAKPCRPRMAVDDPADQYKFLGNVPDDNIDAGVAWRPGFG